MSAYLSAYTEVGHSQRCYPEPLQQAIARIREDFDRIMRYG